MQKANKENIFTVWFFWYFYEMPKFLLAVWKNYILFALNYFSLPVLLKTFFSPWRKYRWVYPKGFDILEFFNALVSNTFSRILGAMMRVVLILLGVIFQLFVVFAGFIVLLLWMAAPLAAVAGFLFAFFF